MTGSEDNITVNHKRNITLYAKLALLIKKIKEEIDKKCNNDLKLFINNQTDKDDFDKYKEMFNKLVKNLPSNIDKIENTYNSDDSEFNFPLLDITIQRTIVQIQEIILAFMVICRKNNLGFVYGYLRVIKDYFTEQVNRIRTQDAGKIKKKKKSKKRKTKKRKTKNKKRKSNKKKLNKKRNKTKKSKK